MSAKLLEIITGKDDVERVACKGNIEQLNAYLKTRPLFIPKRPRYFLDAASFTEQELMDVIQKETKELGGDQFEPWILEFDGKKVLPAFSSQKKMQAFSSKVSQELNKVFSLGCIEILLENVIKNIDVDVVDLNRFSQKSWEIQIGKQK